MSKTGPPSATPNRSRVHRRTRVGIRLVGPGPLPYSQSPNTPSARRGRRAPLQTPEYLEFRRPESESRPVVLHNRFQQVSGRRQPSSPLFFPGAPRGYRSGGTLRGSPVRAFYGGGINTWDVREWSPELVGVYWTVWLFFCRDTIGSFYRCWTSVFIHPV